MSLFRIYLLFSFSLIPSLSLSCLSNYSLDSVSVPHLGTCLYFHYPNSLLSLLHSSSGLSLKFKTETMNNRCNRSIDTIQNQTFRLFAPIIDNVECLNDILLGTFYGPSLRSWLVFGLFTKDCHIKSSSKIPVKLYINRCFMIYITKLKTWFKIKIIKIIKNPDGIVRWCLTHRIWVSLNKRMVRFPVFRL